MLATPPLPVLIAACALAAFTAGPATAVAEVPPPAGTVKGCVVLDGHAAYRGVASLWPADEGKAPDPRRAIRPPLISGPLGEDGCFALQAPPGDYFVGAILRLTEGAWQGPPRPGDRVFLSPDPDGGNTVATVRAGEATDLGRRAASWVYAGFAATTAPYAVSGRLSAPDGAPRPGLLVFAFTDSAMSDEPLAVAEPSDADGRYLLRLPEPAVVYLRAREHYGRRNPWEGGYMGVCGDGEPAALAVDAANPGQSCDFTVIAIPAGEDRRGDVTENPQPRGKN